MARRILTGKWTFHGPKNKAEGVVRKQRTPDEVLDFDDDFYDYLEAPNKNALRGLMIAAGKTEKLPFDVLDFALSDEKKDKD